MIGDAGSVYCDPATGEGADGFETPADAAGWARRQTIWEYGSELDFSDGVSAIIALGSELNTSMAAWEAWEGEGDWPEALGVTNFAVRLGLVAEGDG